MRSSTLIRVEDDRDYLRRTSDSPIELEDHLEELDIPPLSSALARCTVKRRAWSATVCGISWRINDIPGYRNSNSSALYTSH